MRISHGWLSEYVDAPSPQEVARRLTAVGLEVSLKAHRCLLPDIPVGAVEPVLAEHADQSLVLVGHQPSMGALAAHLLGMQSFPRPVPPGTVIGLERTDPTGPARPLFYAAPGGPVLETLT